MVPTTYAHISFSALAHNLTQIKRRIPAACKIMPVVKANAYGHGAIEIAKALVAGGVGSFGVVSSAEGLVLRDAGIAADILVLGPLFEEQIRDVVAYRLTPVVGDERLLRPLAKAADALDSPFPIHLKIDTGMRRLGFPPDGMPALFDRLSSHPSLQIEGVMTHLADADGDDQEATERQLAVFRSTLDPIEKRGAKIPLVHAANSAAIIRFPQSHFSMVRPGIMLYGYHTLPASVAAPDLQPVLTLKTAVSHLRTVQAGDTVSYNRTFVARRRTLIAVLPIGYADGYNRRLSNRGAVLIRGVRAPVVGMVCMDMTMVDVTELPGVKVGDEAVLIGRQGQEAIGADQVAEWIATIPYEVLCTIGPRVPRIYQPS
jgi:alanine racemase